MKWTPLMFFYLLCAIAGLIVPWYYNLQFMMHGDEPFTIRKFIGDGMATPLSSSLTTDFLIGASAAFVWMIIEGIRLKMKRLKMKRLWLFVIMTFLIAFAFAFPLFLFFRERKLQFGQAI